MDEETTNTEGTGTPADAGENQGGINITQEKLNELIDKAHAKGASKAERAVADKLKEYEAKLAKLESTNANGKAGKSYTQEDLDAILERREAEKRAQFAELEQAHQAVQDKAAKMLAKERRAAIVAAAAKHKAVDAADVADLLERHIAHDDDEALIVLDERGKPRLGPKGSPLTVDEFVKTFLDTKPHLKQGTGTTGAGSFSVNGKAQPGKPPKTMHEATAALMDALRGQR